VQGLGMMLSEDVKIDSATGRLLSDSTWTYKIPGAGAYKLTLQPSLGVEGLPGSLCFNMRAALAVWRHGAVTCNQCYPY